MYSFDIIFIAGTHAVGKGHLCSQIEKNISLPIFSASSLIRDAKKSEVDMNKRVIDPDNNQDYLITALRNLNTASRTIVLDGHFCLFDGLKVIDIGIDVFKSIHLKAIIVLFDFPQKIKKKMQDRDGKALDVDIIHALQNRELELGKITADQLNVPLRIISTSESTEVMKWISLML